MTRLISRISKLSFVVCSTLALATACFAQATPAASTTPDSKVEIYAGYGYFHPINADINEYAYHDIYNPNLTMSVSAFWNRYVGAQIEGAYFDGTSPRGALGQCRAGACSDRDPMVYTAEAGPVFRLPMGRWVPYAHLLGGGAKINGPILQKLTWLGRHRRRRHRLRSALLEQPLRHPPYRG